MTDDHYQRFLDEFGHQLERAADRPRRPRRARRAASVAAGVGAAAASVIAVLLAAPGGHQHLDVIGEARAALGARGEVVHLVLFQSVDVGTTNPRDGAASPMPQRTEQWTTADPPRWRISLTYPEPRAANTPAIGDAEGPITGPVQFAYDNGTQSTYIANRNTLERTRGPSQDGPPSQVPSATPLGNDPIATLRAMLDRGDVRDDGETTIDGRTVRRLVGQAPRTTISASVMGRVEYDVDAQSFVPVAARIELPTPPVPGSVRPVTPTLSVRFEMFERLPLNDSTQRLLQIQVAGQPTIIDRSGPSGR